MKKNKITLILLIIIIMAISLLFSSCDKKDINNTDAPTFTINFVTNDPKIIIEPLIISDNNAIMPENPVRARYTFLGWYYNEEYSRLFLVEDGISENLTLYAKWKDNSSTGSEINPPIYVESGSFSYREYNDYYSITGYKGTDSEIVIPESYNKKPVIEIGKFAFKDNTIIEKITIGSVLQNIEEGAFENCNHLSEFNVSGSDYFLSDNGVLYNRDKNSILQIGMGKNIESFEIGKNIEIIRNGAFYGAKFDITFENGGKYNEIKTEDFYGFEGKMHLNSNIESIEEKAFNGYKGEVVFEESNNITTLTLGAFYGYNGKTINLPSKITQIYNYAFANCSANVNLLNTSITTINNHTFNNYTGENLVIPNTVINIGEDAFYKSTANITFQSESNLTTLSNLSFSMFMGTVILPESVINIENNAFWEIYSQAEVYFSVSRNQLNVSEEYIDAFDSIENIYFS